MAFPDRLLSWAGGIHLAALSVCTALFACAENPVSVPEDPGSALERLVRPPRFQEIQAIRAE